jgi:iron complex outermembrane receptor protein
MSNLAWVSQRALLAGCAISAISTASPALAQDAAQASIEEVVVTGSLVMRNGNQAPTPVTVIDTTALQQAAPSNIPDGLNQLPQFSGSRSQTQNPQNGTAGSPAAGNYLNLRNLGIVRSLILVDGQRVPPTSFEGTVDTNVLPQALVQRVDVVTAGASATYGSDAVSGVVNFVLDKKFTGFKGSVQGGVSQSDDDNSYRVSLAAGRGFLGGRGHVILSAEHYLSDGIKLKADRPLYDQQFIAYGNGTTVPYRYLANARQNNASAGGVILTGPLAQQKFNSDGTLSPYDRGSLTPIGGIQIGGDGGLALNSSLVGSLRTDQAFGRVSYDLTDTISAYAQVIYGESRNRYAHNGADNRFGNLTIFSGNAFLRPEQQAALTAAGTASFTMGRDGFEQGRKTVDILNDSLSVMAGLDGKFGGDWSWRLNYAGGQSIMRAKHTRNPENPHYFAAIDAVRDPSGAIVCRVTLTNPGLYPGCVPLNILGADRASKEALEYSFGADSQYDARNEQHDVAFTVTGPIFKLPAGEVNLAGGIEYRTQSLEMRSNADPAIPPLTTGIRGYPLGAGRFGNTNQGQSKGDQTVREAFGEIVVPLLKDLPGIENLEFNGAARVTDYKTSGRVETWKAGLSYSPIKDLRIRATRSRDIRAPTLNELFAGTLFSSAAVTDLHTGQTVTTSSSTSGNPDLVPEVGSTTTVGLVYQPAWFSGFTASIDYYDIKIRDAIATRSPPQLQQDCEDSNGTGPACAFLIRPLPFSDRSPANALQRTLLVPFNQSSAYTHGIDFDAGYRFPMSNVLADSNAILTLRLLANYSPSYKTLETATSPVQQRAGLGGDLNNSTGNPKLRTTLSANWQAGPLTINLQQRFIGKMVRSYVSNIKYEDNSLKSITYYNLSGSYKFEIAGRKLEAFANINNLLDKDPPIVPYTAEPGLRYPTLQGLYDVVGRYYTGGLRFSF